MVDFGLVPAGGLPLHGCGVPGLSPFSEKDNQRLLAAVTDSLRARVATRELPEWWADAPVMLVVSGSNAYGIASGGSDVDFLGVYVPPATVRGSLFPSMETVQVKTSVDGVPCEGTLYSLKKFLLLCETANPTVMELLWSPMIMAKRSVVSHLWTNYGDPPAKTLRVACTTRKIRWTTGGYAVQQFRRIKTHRNWMLGVCPDKPDRKAFGLPERPEHWTQALEAAVRREKGLWCLDGSEIDPGARVELEERLQAIVARYEGAGISVDDAVYAHLGLSPEAIVRLSQEAKYSEACKQFEGYQNWLKNRNPVRAELERKYGFDTKHASHLVRLARLGCEGLLTGKLQYDRRGIDADELKAIRAGAWTWEQIAEFGESVDARLAEADAKSTLPRAADKATIDTVYRDMCNAAWSDWQW